MIRNRIRLAVLAVGLLVMRPVGAAEHVNIGSKAFPESWILGESLKALAEQAGATAEHKSNLGGTEVVYRGLISGDPKDRLDVYPDYTGTVAEVLMKAKGRPSLEEMRAFLRGQGIGMSDSLGFNDGYGLAVLPETQDRLGIKKISDLAAHPDLRLGFTHEFVGRKDGWAGLAQHYGLSLPDVRGMDHQLAYGALAAKQIDLTEVYTTDAKIQKLKLRILEDDRSFFPRYEAVLLYRLDLPQRAPKAFAAMQKLVGKINEEKMIRANAMVETDKKTQREAAAALLSDVLGGSSGVIAKDNVWREIGQRTLEHLGLVGISLLGAILLGIPLGILAAEVRPLASLLLGLTGLIQTIPSLVLLALMIPLLSIGPKPAIVALILYSLLPIVRNTYVGLTTVPPQLSEAAEALGLSAPAQLRRVRLPMAMPAIMAGIKTSAVINVGTATIAAFIGAGGLGNPILTGISLQRTDLILQGAIPAAILALLVQGAFDLLERWVVPKGLRLTAGA